LRQFARLACKSERLTAIALVRVLGWACIVHEEKHLGARATPRFRLRT